MQPPVKNRRVIYSVSFTPAELAAVSQKAASEGKRTGTYIRERALAGVSVPTIHLLVDGETVSVGRTA